MSRQVLTYPDMPPVLTQSAGDARYLQQGQADARYLQLTGGTVSGALEVTGNTTTRNVNLFGAAVDRWVRFAGLGGSPLKWYVGTDGAEEDFLVYRWRPDGSGPFTGLNINRNSGTVTIGQNTGSPAIMVADGVALAVGGQAFTWDAGWDVIQFPNQAIACNGAAANTMEIIANSYVSGGVRRAMVGTLPAVMVHLTGGAFEVHSAPLVATGAQQAFGRRMLIDTATGTAYFYPIPGNWSAFFNQSVGPLTDNFANLGYTANRWIGVYAVQGAINTCSREVKEILGAVNDATCLEQLMSLPAIYRFHYKHQQDDPENEGQHITVTDTSMEFIGPVAEDMPSDMKVGEVTGGNVNTEGHLMASLRGAVKEYRAQNAALTKRIEALEAARV